MYIYMYIYIYVYTLYVYICIYKYVRVRGHGPHGPDVIRPKTRPVWGSRWKLSVRFIPRLIPDPSSRAFSHIAEAPIIPSDLGFEVLGFGEKERARETLG